MTTQPIKTLIAVENGVSRETVHVALPEYSDAIDIVGLVEGFDDAWPVLQETPTDLLVVACASGSDRGLYLVGNAVKQRPERPVIVLAEGGANGFVQRAFEAGADDFISLPESSAGVMFVLQKAMARRRGAAVANGIALAPLICVIGPKGGTGKTLTAANLAVGIAAEGRRVAVVDLDLQFGDVGLSLGLSPEKTIYDLASAGGTIDVEKITGFVTRHSSGVDVLLAPTRPDHAGAISVPFLRDVYANLRTAYDFVIVDTPPGFSPEVIAAIDTSTHLCMVGMLDALSLKNTKIGFETLDLMGYSRERIRFVLNRADTRVGISREDVIGLVGTTPDVWIPSSRDIPRAINEGVPIVVAAQKSEAARGFRTLAGLYVAEADAAASGSADSASHRSLFRRRRAA